MMGEKDGAVAFFDVDGTLVWHDAEKVASGEYDFSSATPTPAVYEAFHRLHVAGHRAFICTGRPVPFILDSLRALEPDGYIAAAGAYVQVGDTVVRDASIPDDLLLETVRRFVDAGIDLMLESNTQSVEVHPSGAPAEFASSGLVRSADELGGFLRDHRFAKFCVSGCPLEALAPVLPFCERHFTIADLQFGTHDGHVEGPRIHQLAAIRTVELLQHIVQHGQKVGGQQLFGVQFVKAGGQAQLLFHRAADAVQYPLAATFKIEPMATFTVTFF